MGHTRDMRVMVKIPMGYTRRAHVDRGQIISLEGMPNDERLLKLGYLEEVSERAETYECSECGEPFATMGYRSAHVTLRHPVEALTDDEVERREDRVQEQLNRELVAGTLLNLPTS